jgi:hypothetical protein
MSELSKSDVVRVLGPRLSDAAIAEIIATGITEGELVSAKDRVLRDRKAHDPGPKLTPGHVAKVVDILERMHSSGLFGEAGSTLE